MHFYHLKKYINLARQKMINQYYSQCALTETLKTQKQFLNSATEYNTYTIPRNSLGADLLKEPLPRIWQSTSITDVTNMNKHARRGTLIRIYLLQ